MNIDEAIAVLEEKCHNPETGLPEDVFLFLTRLTPMVNVDLLIKDDKGRTLLTWRDDIYCGSGWHFPGGIVHLKETSIERVETVAKLELGCEVTAESRPIALNECIEKTQLNRGHSYSLLYRCKLNSPPLRKLKYHGGKPQPSMYKFFDNTPINILKVHNMYRQYINN